MMTFIAPWHLLSVVVVIASAGLARSQFVLPEPARVSCDAKYSAPCARTNSEYLAISAAIELGGLTSQGDIEERVARGGLNMETGFYPFVFDRSTAVCVAHGAIPALAGMSIHEIFDSQNISYVNTTALHERFVDAADRGGDWVQYLWNDGDDQANSKLAYVVPLGDDLYLGVGYESRRLPADLPCTDEFDSWCSLTNVRSLVGAAQFRLNQAENVENFEAGLHEISFDEDYQIAGGFFIFVYSYSGSLKAHGVLHDSLGMDLSEIVVENRVGSAQEGDQLHEDFIEAAEGKQGGWVRYPWRNGLGESTYLKIAFIVKIEFEGEQYYLGSGYRFAMDEIGTGPQGEPCDPEYNAPCAFRTALQLSSHALNHAISSRNDVDGIFASISDEDEFKVHNFYLFFYDFNNTCVSHGQRPDYVGKTLNEVYEINDIPLNATVLHNQFAQAAEDGGGWVLYDWVNPDVANSDFQKISYIFRLNLYGRDYYGGVGFNHKRAPTEQYVQDGRANNGQPILCSTLYGFDCSGVNAQAILGQALAETTLASTESRISSSQRSSTRTLEEVLTNITNQSDEFRMNDFHAIVFSVDGADCPADDGSGCCIAHGSDQGLVNKSWQEILDQAGVTSIAGNDLHKRLTAASNLIGGDVEYPYSRKSGTATFKHAWVARFRNDTKDFYIVSETLLTQPPPTCNACQNGTECTQDDQEYCEEIEASPIDSSLTKGFIIMFSILVPLLILGFFMLRRRSKRRARQKIEDIKAEMVRLAKKLDDQLVGIVEVVYNMPIVSPQKYMLKVVASGHGVESATPPEEEAFWAWEEDGTDLSGHKSFMVLPVDGRSFVRYSNEGSDQIENAYRQWKDGMGPSMFCIDLTGNITSTVTGNKVKNVETGSQYEIDFGLMVQRNSTTRHERKLHRGVIDVPIDSEVGGLLPPLPNEVDFADGAENLLPVFMGQVIQCSKTDQTQNWLFGNVLYDPLLSAAKEGQSDNNAVMNDLIANALHDRPTSGWFPKSMTAPADMEVMKKLIKTLGNDGLDSLEPPLEWDRGEEGRLQVPKGSKEYQETTDFFIASLHGSLEVTITSVERLQNLALYQTYAVKKQTMLKDHDHAVNNLGDIERRLFHGTKADVIPKVEKQGFNRSFAGVNGVRFGRGVYFARDASYSCSYASKDTQRKQRIFICRVAVGDWCQGTNDQLIPNPKSHNSLELFDSTVDNVQNPSVFVVYHDAQAYPEYLIEFK